MIGTPEIILVLAVALILFGPRKLPELGKTLGKGIKNFKDSVSGIDEVIVNPIKDKDSEEEKKKDENSANHPE